MNPKELIGAEIIDIKPFSDIMLEITVKKDGKTYKIVPQKPWGMDFYEELNESNFI